ncbi:Major facilitator superfamily [Trinorchestia longiramus]|nr:Major facilitator superfamily [Trinorchestia longiramus]
MAFRSESEECLLGSDRPPTIPAREGVCNTLKQVLSNITVEPVLFIYVLANCTSALTTNLLLDRVCSLTFSGNETVCGNLSHYSDLQSNVEKTTAQISLYCSLVSSLPSILLGPLMGAYSDVHGRKLPLIIPIIGSIVSALAQMVFAYLPSADPLWLVACAVPRGLMGGFAVVIMACYSYISDQSRHRSRTSRIAAIDAVMVLALPLGLILSNVLYAELGYWPVYGITAGLYVVALLYAAVRINDSTAPHAPLAASSAAIYGGVDSDGGQAQDDDSCDHQYEEPRHEATPEIVRQRWCCGGCVAVLRTTGESSVWIVQCCGGCVTVFKRTSGGSSVWIVQCCGGCVEALKETLETCCKERPHHGRAKLWALIFALCCLVSTFSSSNFLFLYLKKRFDFSYFNFINLAIAGLVVDLVGSFLILYGLSYRLGVADLWLGLVSSLVLMTTTVLKGLASTLALLFTATGLSFCALVPLVVIRSQLSKSVGALEVGKVFSFVSAAESILPIVVEPVFTALFKATLDTVPGTVFFVAAGGYALSALSLG